VNWAGTEASSSRGVANAIVPTEPSSSVFDVVDRGMSLV
jgi:hypothetical protein